MLGMGTKNISSKTRALDVCGGPVVESLPTSAEDTVRSPVQEDSIYRGAPKPVHHSYRSLRFRACVPQQEMSPQREAHAQLREAPAHRKWRKSMQ